MSDAIEKPSGFRFWFTAILVIAGFLLFALMVRHFYLADRPEASTVPVTLSAEKRMELNLLTPEERAERLKELRASAEAAATSYGWIDKEKGIVRLPIDRAIELYAAEQASANPTR
ncbi:MAG: hypothetical protein D6781_04295 [Verrucomicrobia bacterium]|nr:MAG: hypothetical protein D6781_04295 [Verrucomicrobiota bacterium]